MVMPLNIVIDYVSKSQAVLMGFCFDIQRFNSRGSWLSSHHPGDDRCYKSSPLQSQASPTTTSATSSSPDPATCWKCAELLFMLREYHNYSYHPGLLASCCEATTAAFSAASTTLPADFAALAAAQSTDSAVSTTITKVAATSCTAPSNVPWLRLDLLCFLWMICKCNIIS